MVWVSQIFSCLNIDALDRLLKNALCVGNKVMDYGTIDAIIGSVDTIFIARDAQSL